MTALSPEVQQRLRLTLQMKKQDGAIPRRPGARDRFPLSFSQERLWRLYRQQPRSTAYNVVKGYILGGDGQPPLDLPLLERCFNDVVARHESLRTVFRAEEGVPMQIVLPSLHVPLQYVDGRASAADEAQRWADLEAETPFDLERGPLLRLRVVQLDELRFAVLMSMHHIVFDGWSSGVFVDDMTAFYQAHAAGTAPPLAPLPIQYTDYAAWQRERFSGAALEAELRFWREHLGDVRPLALPADRPRPPIPSDGGGTVQFTFSRELSDALNALARREGVTMFMLFLAAYDVLLSRVSGSDNVLAGTIMAGRHRRETERLIGFFVNTVVLRGDLSGDPPFRNLLGRVRESSLAAHAHQEFPFERLADELRPDGRTPLVQAMFVVHNWKKPSMIEGGFHSESICATRRTSRFDLSLGLEEKSTWCGSLEYATDLFDEATAQWMVARLERILAAVAANPEAKVSEL
ncbi:MAG TPA: condensation domain-containing protein [Thermoanaerobaculia bacterium]|jgi:non-ribosomal peptide synthetase component F